MVMKHLKIVTKVIIEKNKFIVNTREIHNSSIYNEV